MDLIPWQILFLLASHSKKWGGIYLFDLWNAGVHRNFYYHSSQVSKILIQKKQRKQHKKNPTFPCGWRIVICMTEGIIINT